MKRAVHARRRAAYRQYRHPAARLPTYPCTKCRLARKPPGKPSKLTREPSRQSQPPFWVYPNLVTYCRPVRGCGQFRSRCPPVCCEIRWYRFGPPDRKRPVLVLTRDSILPYLGEVTVAPITTTVRDIPSEVLLDADDGMPRRCAVNCDHLQTVSKAKLGNLVARLPVERLGEVQRAVSFALGF